MGRGSEGKCVEAPAGVGISVWGEAVRGSVRRHRRGGWGGAAVSAEVAMAWGLRGRGARTHRVEGEKGLGG